MYCITLDGEWLEGGFREWMDARLRQMELCRRDPVGHYVIDDEVDLGLMFEMPERRPIQE